MVKISTDLTQTLKQRQKLENLFKKSHACNHLQFQINIIHKKLNIKNNKMF